MENELSLFNTDDNAESLLCRKTLQFKFEDICISKETISIEISSDEDDYKGDSPCKKFNNYEKLSNQTDGDRAFPIYNLDSDSDSEQVHIPTEVQVLSQESQVLSQESQVLSQKVLLLSQKALASPYLPSEQDLNSDKLFDDFIKYIGGISDNKSSQQLPSQEPLSSSFQTCTEFFLKNKFKTARCKNDAVPELLVIINSDWIHSNVFSKELLDSLALQNIKVLLSETLSQKLYDVVSQDGVSLKKSSDTDGSFYMNSGKAFVDTFCPCHFPIRVCRLLTPSLAEKRLSKHTGIIKIFLDSKLCQSSEQKILFEFVPLSFGFHFVGNQSFYQALQSQAFLSYFSQKISQFKESFAQFPALDDGEPYFNFCFLGIDKYIRGLENKKKQRTVPLSSHIHDFRLESSASQEPSSSGIECKADTSLEDAFVQIQLAFPNTWISLFKASTCLVEWITESIRTLSIAPYRKTTLDLGYCTLVKKTKGSSSIDTFKKMLMEIHSISDSVAGCISETYGSCYHLIQAYKKTSVQIGELLLTNLEVKRAKTTKKIGEALSKKIYQAFMCSDPNRRLD